MPFSSIRRIGGHFLKMNFGKPTTVHVVQLKLFISSVNCCVNFQCKFLSINCYDGAKRVRMEENPNETGTVCTVHRMILGEGKAIAMSCSKKHLLSSVSATFCLEDLSACVGRSEHRNKSSACCRTVCGILLIEILLSMAAEKK